MGGKPIILTVDEGVLCRYVLNQTAAGKEVTLNGASRAIGFCTDKTKKLILDLTERRILSTTSADSSAGRYNVHLAVPEERIVIRVERRSGFTPEQTEAIKEGGLEAEITPEIKAFILKHGRKMKRSELAERLRIPKSKLIMVLIALEDERAAQKLQDKLGGFKQEAEEKFSYECY